MNISVELVLDQREPQFPPQVGALGGVAVTTNAKSVIRVRGVDP
jgi:hypothetical protein